ncbi:MAG TPA: TonB-dependent receptor [Bdellovibrionota bacterium]|jgi:vitamin B12 transporter
MRVLIFLPLLLSHPVSADDKILVTATRSEASESDLPFSLSSIEGDRWEAAGGQAEKALSTVPGLAFAANGASGQTRSLFIRGAKAEHTLVLVDGIPVNDPLSPSRSFDFAQIPVSEIERVEIIKGPQSVLYGSDAMGGVVQIFTKRSRGSRLRFEGGSYSTGQAQVSAMGFRGGYFETKGFSAADEHEGNGERDGHRMWNIGGKKSFAMGETFLMNLNAQYADSRTDTDRNGGLRGDSSGTFARNRQLLLREENVAILPGEAELTVAGSLANRERDDNTNGADFYQSTLWKAESVLRKPKLGNHSLTAGLEYGEESGRSSQTTGGLRRFRMGAVFLQDQLVAGRFHGNLGARFDLHSEHGNAQTYRSGLGYWIQPERMRVKASVGTGFKAPSLYQTYSRYGSTNLNPERSLGADLGAELKGGSWLTELTLFGNRFRDMIDYNLVSNRYFNQAKAETFGLEWQLEKRWGGFRIANAATWMRAYDANTSLPLMRRPKFTDTLESGFSREKHWGVNLLARYVGTRDDSHPVLFTRQPMPAFWTLGADGYKFLAEGLRLTARGENLLNRRYQETSGYGVPALSAYVGLETDL